MIHRIALVTSLVISTTAAYFSIVGLATIFTGAYWSVVLMATALEVGKVVTVGWLSRNWSSAPNVIKYYLGVSVCILMFITSLGTFGYLSRAHLETTDQVRLSQLQIEPLEIQLRLAEQRLSNAQTSLDSLDRIVGEMDVDKASLVVQRQKSQRGDLTNEITSASRDIQALNAKILPLRTQQTQTEAEIGPLKYVAELVYGEDAERHFDSAVRFVIIIIVFVFDPLAIVLLIAANHGMKPKSRMRFDKETRKLVIDNFLAK
jgi:hypothetical protein